jgi:hypothetical protein
VRANSGALSEGSASEESPFLCMFTDTSYGPYADATLIVPWDLRFELEDR